MNPSIDELRRYAIARSLFRPTTLARAIDRLGFVQADPIRAPARAQDLTLRHRVSGYRAGDLERRYPKLQVEEDFFVNYGFLARAHVALMHPRVAAQRWDAVTMRRARDVLQYVRERGTAHPREIDAHFAHGKVTNYWGGSSNASTHLLLGMHYRGMLRVARRDNGVRVYAVQQHAAQADDPPSRGRRLDALLDLVAHKYAPLPGTSLGSLARRLRHGAPQLADDIGPALARARQRLAHARIDGVEWFWPGDEQLPGRRPALRDDVRLLAPFDPVVWDRRRFELFWRWTYRFEAYTPAARRKLGYYALPLLWRDQVIGWGNLAVDEGRLVARLGYVDGAPPRDRTFRRELEAELARMSTFLGSNSPP